MMESPFASITVGMNSYVSPATAVVDGEPEITGATFSAWAPTALADPASRNTTVITSGRGLRHRLSIKFPCARGTRARPNWIVS